MVSFGERYFRTVLIRYEYSSSLHRSTPPGPGLKPFPLEARSPASRSFFSAGDGPDDSRWGRRTVYAVSEAGADHVRVLQRGRLRQLQAERIPDGHVHGLGVAMPFSTIETLARACCIPLAMKPARQLAQHWHLARRLEQPITAALSSVVASDLTTSTTVSGARFQKCAAEATRCASRAFIRSGS